MNLKLDLSPKLILRNLCFVNPLYTIIDEIDYKGKSTMLYNIKIVSYEL